QPPSEPWRGGWVERLVIAYFDAAAEQLEVYDDGAVAAVIKHDVALVAADFRAAGRQSEADPDRAAFDGVQKQDFILPRRGFEGSAEVTQIDGQGACGHQ